jgi:flagellar protein FliJ
VARDRRQTLDRLLRVRTLQLTLVQAEEARTHDKFASETALQSRIAALADSVAPTPSASEGLAFIAAAHFRDRLQQSAEAASARLRVAEQQVEQAAARTREARRDQNAIEKLIGRADADAALKALREMESAPAFRKIRHDPC